MPREGPEFSLVRKIFLTMLLTLILLSSVPCSLGSPVELLRNGNFKNGLDGWKTEGVAFLDEESIKMVREGSLSQIVERPDLSLYLELSYGVRTELPSKTYFARSLVTFYVIDRQKKNSRFTIVGEAHQELGNSRWKEFKLSLLKRFLRDVGDPESFQLVALKVALELGFNTSVPPPAVACFRNISLKRVNPARILLHEGRWREMLDRTELLISLTNVGDMDASNLVVTLISGPEILVISERSAFDRSTLEGGASWQLSWMLATRLSGVHSVTITVASDQTGAELSLSVPVAGIPRMTATQTSTITVEKEQPTKDVLVVFAQIAFLVMVAFVVFAMVIPIILSRRGREVVFRLRLTRNHATQALSIESSTFS